MVAVRQETGSTKWMLFGLIYPMIIGFISAVLIFSGGSALGLSGIETMIAFYILALIFMLGMAFIKPNEIYEE
jgi:ferrous iron transport protein B